MKQKTIQRFAERLNVEIGKQHDPLQIEYIQSLYMRGEITDDELVEARGFYKGLRAAQRMLLRTCCEEYEHGSCKDCPIYGTACEGADEE